MLTPLFKTDFLPLTMEDSQDDDFAAQTLQCTLWAVRFPGGSAVQHSPTVTQVYSPEKPEWSPQSRS